MFKKAVQFTRPPKAQGAYLTHPTRAAKTALSRWTRPFPAKAAARRTASPIS